MPPSAVLLLEVARPARVSSHHNQCCIATQGRPSGQEKRLEFMVRVRVRVRMVSQYSTAVYIRDNSRLADG